MVMTLDRHHPAAWLVGLVLGLGVSACASDPGETCEVGALGCECFDGSACAGALTCMGGICVLPDGADTNDEVEADDEDSTSADEDSTSADEDSTTVDEDSTTVDEDSTTVDEDSTTVDDDSTTLDDESTTVDESTDDDPTDDTAGGPCAGPEVLLFSQDAGADGTGAPSAVYPDFGDFIVELADDFTIPANDSCWCITRLVTRGYFEGQAVSNPPVFLTLYYDDAGKPGVPNDVWFHFDDPTDETMGDFTVEAPPDTIVESGKYWVNFAPVLELETIWNWAMETTTSGSPAHARDGIDLVYSCPTWTPLGDCYDIPGGYQPSLQFDIYGTVGGAECN
jgi:hypothetical protein